MEQQALHVTTTTTTTITDHQLSINPDPDPNLHNLNEDFDSTCSTPYVSAPSSPGRGGIGDGGGGCGGGVGFFYSCPASPMHFAITTTAVSAFASSPSSPDNNIPLGYEFEFSSRSGSVGSSQTGSMSSADELFLNGKIRPMKLSTHLERPQMLAPLIDLENEEDDFENEEEEQITKATTMMRGRDLRLRDKSLKRRTRSMSPLRRTSSPFGFVSDNNNSINIHADDDDDDDDDINNDKINEESVSCEVMKTNNEENSNATTPSVSASSSRSSSAGRNSKRWVFLKDFLYRSKSEGRSSSNNKFWSNISFSISQTKDKKTVNVTNNNNQVGVSKEKGLVVNNNNGSSTSNNNNNNNNGSMEKQVKGSTKKLVNGIGKRRVPTSPHELHYKASRAQAEEMRKRTFLPYRQGLLGCLGFSSKGYGAMNGFARTLNPVSSR